ncbi:glycosyltransferase family 4 protein [Granulosicoccus sp. 3-233]|uniref:glycosyltransferase family 4 protein n=1 Tax=Granulosicoccus sp. 3-233 TaxID=3417969 RepID=UPI003D328D12
MKKIAFYAPLKPAGHPVPSGDRLMARQLIGLLEQAACEVDVASEQRAFLRDAHDQAALQALQQSCEREVQRLTRQWQEHGAPDAWFCYHPYYKSPDLIGPVLCQAFDVPYVTAEASLSARRNEGLWADMQERVREAIELAAVNLCFTRRDRLGLQAAAPKARLADLQPFIDTQAFTTELNGHDPHHLVAVAMMRGGDKLHSYQHLASALQSLLHLPWQLSIVGDGPLQADVRQLFSAIPDTRIHWHGQLEPAAIAQLFARCGLYVWPGCGEAYGLAYLEAQAAGLPVVAYRTAGVPEVVCDRQGGVLTPPADATAYAAAIGRLLSDTALQQRMAVAATERVQREHSTQAAVRTLQTLLQGHLWDDHQADARS